MAVVNVWAGAVTQDSALVVAKVDSSAAVSVEVDTDPGFTGPVSHGPSTPSAENIARIQVSGLASETRYHFRVVHDGTPDASFQGQFRTHPVAGQAASFTIAAASCAGTAPDTPGSGAVLAANRLSNHHVFDTIRTQALAGDWLGIFHMGDLHYYDLGSGSHGITGGGSLANYRRAVDDVLLQPRQHDLYRSLPVTWMYDDHDWGPNDSDGNLPDRANALQAYRERAPYYPLPVSGTAEPNYQSIQIGRVLFAVWDCRSESSPGSDPDTPAKVVLSGDQKAWFSSLLATTTAEALVIVSTRQWEHPSGGDTWAGYTFDRQAVIDILATPGITGQDWLDRTCLIQGDAHSTGMSSGNSYGGFPVYQFAPLDSSVGAPQSWKNLGSFANHGQYGTLQVVDDGDQITITATGWHAAQADEDPIQLLQHSFTVETSTAPTPTPPPPDPGLVPVAQAQIRNAVTWLGINDATGRTIAELPDMETGEIGRLLTAYASTKLTYPLVQSGPGGIPIETLVQATRPQRTSIIAIVNDLPVWGGRVLERVGGSDKDLILGCATSEQYLLNRLVTDREFVGVDRALIAQELLSDAGSIDQGPGMALEVEVTLTGDVIDRIYKASDQMTVYDALRALATGGLEWTIDLDFESAAGTVVRRIMRLGPRIGRAGVDVPLFESDGPSDSRYTLDENFTSDRYANAVSAYGTGQGDDLPRSATVYDQAALDAGAPVVHKSVHVSDTNDPVELLQVAQSELARLKWGAELWRLDSLFNAFPRLGFDAGLGDDVNWNVTGPRHPGGVQGAGRMIGWLLKIQGGRWNPLLLDPHEEVV